MIEVGAAGEDCWDTILAQDFGPDGGLFVLAVDVDEFALLLDEFVVVACDDDGAA